jgi:hypothetical protein
MAEVLKVKYYDIETGNEIPMSQEDEGKEKKKWKKRLYWAIGFFLIGVGYGFGSGGGPYSIQVVTITAVTPRDKVKMS